MGRTVRGIYSYSIRIYSYATIHATVERGGVGWFNLGTHPNKTALCLAHSRQIAKHKMGKIIVFQYSMQKLTPLLRDI